MAKYQRLANETPPTLLTPTDWREYLNNELDLYENIYVTSDGKLNIKFRNAPKSQPDKNFAIKLPNVVNIAGLMTRVYYFPRDKTINDVRYKPFKLAYSDDKCFWGGPYIDDQFVHMERGYGIGNQTEAEVLHHVVEPYGSYVPTDPFRKYSLYIYVGLEYRPAEYFAIYIP